MAQQGTFGELDVPVFERTDVSSPYIHIAGVGYLALDPIAEMNTPTYVVHTDSGKYAVAKSIAQEIDYYDDGSLSEYTLSDHGSNGLTTDSKAGQYAFELTGYTWADATSGALPNYPIDALNGAWDMWWKASWDTDSLRAETLWAYENYENCYMTKITDGCIRIRVKDPNVNDHGSHIVIENFIDFNENQWYRVNHDWTDNGDGTHDLTLSVYLKDGTFVDDASATIDYTKTGRGLYFEVYDGCTITYDQLAVVE